MVLKPDDWAAQLEARLRELEKQVRALQQTRGADPDES